MVGSTRAEGLRSHPSACAWIMLGCRLHLRPSVWKCRVHCQICAMSCALPVCVLGPRSCEGLCGRHTQAKRKVISAAITLQRRRPRESITLHNASPGSKQGGQAVADRPPLPPRGMEVRSPWQVVQFNRHFPRKGLSTTGKGTQSLGQYLDSGLTDAKSHCPLNAKSLVTHVWRISHGDHDTLATRCAQYHNSCSDYTVSARSYEQHDSPHVDSYQRFD